MASEATMQKLSEVRSRINDDNRVSLSDFSRGKEWRKKLSRDEFMELQEHGERMAWIISEEGMREVVDYIAELEEQLERASVEAMFRARSGREDWKSGDELKDAALAYFRDNRDELMKAAGID